jgi:hypothetical protein
MPEGSRIAWQYATRTAPDWLHSSGMISGPAQKDLSRPDFFIQTHFKSVHKFHGAGFARKPISDCGLRIKT